MTVSERRVRVYDDKASLAAAVAARFIKRMRETLAEKPDAHVVLTGGSMGEAVLAAVGADKNHGKVDWSRITFWWGDERYLPSGDPDRNETQSRRALLDSLGLPAERIKALPALGEHATIAEAAEAYAAELAAAAPEGAAYPVFDLTFLGVGPDGHVIYNTGPTTPGVPLGRGRRTSTLAPPDMPAIADQLAAITPEWTP